MTLLFCIGSSAFNDIKAQTTESTVTIPANAESLAEAGNAQESGVAPINNNYQYSISQIYYTSDEINRKEDGVIKGISFKTKDNNENNYPYTREIEIYLVNTIETAFSSKLMMQFSESDLYFKGNVEFSAEAWVTITLDKAFTYKGGNNVLICVNDKYYSDNAPDDGKDYVSPTAEFYAYTSGNTMRCLNHKNTSSTYDPTNTSITNLSSIGNTGNLPFIQFTFEENLAPITLIPSPDYITTCDKVTFTVMQGEGTGTDVTTSATIYQVDGTETIELGGNTFTPSAAGEYTFYAKKGSVQSENIIINVTEAPYVLKASPTNIMADNEDITTFSVTQCGNTVTGFTFYVDGNEIDGNTFSTAELGEHTVYATNGDITTSEITIYATEWKVTGWVTGNNFVNSIYGSNLNVVEIYDGNFRLWVLIDNNKNGIIINNNIELLGDGFNKTYNQRSGHRPEETPQPLSIPETITIDEIGTVTITKIEDNVFCNMFDADNYGIYESGNSLNNNISSLTIPSTITEIGNKAFDFAYGEGFTITSKATAPPTIGNNTFGRKSTDNNTINNYYKTLYVPSSSLEDYKTAEYWELFFEYGGNIEVDPGSIIQYNGDGNWTETNNWSNRELPTETDEVTINGNVKINTNVNVNVININENCSLTIQGEYTLRVNNIINNGNIVIEDGGQLYYNGEDELTVTVEKNIIGYGDEYNVKDGWYTISSPVYSVEDMGTYGDAPYYYVAINDVTNLIPTNHNYDLYRYYEPGTTMEVGWWENYKQGESQLDEMLPDFTILSNGHGYLYASSDNVNLEFSGKVLTGSVIHHCYKMNLNEDFNGFNLMGNPFTHDITLNNVTNLGMANGFYTVTNAGTWETHSSTDNIKPTQGMLIKITDTSIDSDGFGFLTISEEETRSRSINNGSINIVVSNDKYSDNAIVSFSEGKGLNKFPHLNKEAHEVYVIDNDTKYGVATMNDDVTTIPVGFKANTMGQYTISAEAKDCKFNSMTLTDKMTGVKTNLLTDSYTFMATTNDNPNRFTLTLNADTDNDNDFIYINNNEMIINNIEGDGLVQIYDVMGRSVATYNVSGSANISMETLSEGVYIVRMIDANGVKTQKVVNN